MLPATVKVQQEISARLEQFSKKGQRSGSEQIPHLSLHLWGVKKSRKRTSAPQMGSFVGGLKTALVLRSRRSWPVAPVTVER